MAITPLRSWSAQRRGTVSVEVTRTLSYYKGASEDLPRASWNKSRRVSASFLSCLTNPLESARHRCLSRICLSVGDRGSQIFP
jgi:hypothetical protein